MIEDWRCQEQIDELISEFLEDLKSIDAPLKPYPTDPIAILIKKWEKRLKV